MKHKLIYFLVILFLASTNSLFSKNQSPAFDSLSKSVLLIDARLDTLEKNIINLKETTITTLKKQNEMANNLKTLECYSGLIINLFISILGGIFGGLIIIGCQKLKHKKKLREICEPLVGNYNVLNIANESVEVGAKINITYKSENVIETNGTSLGNGEWKGRLVIDEHSPDWGSGFYRYYKKGPQGNENGLHRVIIDRANGRLYVNIETFTHDQQNTKANIWQKCQK